MRINRTPDCMRNDARTGASCRAACPSGRAGARRGELVLQTNFDGPQDVMISFRGAREAPGAALRSAGSFLPSGLGTILEEPSQALADSSFPADPTLALASANDVMPSEVTYAESPAAVERKKRIIESMITLDNPELEGLDKALMTRHIVRNLAALPEEHLAKVAARGVKILPVRRGQSIAGTPLARRLEDVGHMKEIAPAARELLESEKLRRLGEFEKEKQQLLLGKFATKRGETYSSFKKMCETRLPLRVNDALAPEFGLKSGEKFNLGTLAFLHGAREENEIKEFCSITADCNTGRFARKGNPDEALPPGNEPVLIPNVFYRTSAEGTERYLMSQGLYDSAIANPQEMTLRDGINGLYENKTKLLVVALDVLDDPSPSLGHYRVLLHEFGHALDCAIDEEGKAGESHRKRMEGLFWDRIIEAGRSARTPDDFPFLVSNSTMNDREFFADAYEAYHTVNLEDRAEQYKKELSRDNLIRKDPELSKYLDEISSTP